VVALAVVATALIVLVPLASRHENPPGFAAPPGYDSQPVRAPELLLIGDSFAEGTGAESPGQGFASLLAVRTRWTLITDAEGGTGYVENGPDGSERKAYVERSANHQGADSDFVVVTGGINDRTLLKRGDVTWEQYADAVGQTLDNLQAAHPTAA
jgi:lysophospholipase L1-like esterase